MNANLSDLTFLLDRSGSMESIRDAAIDGFNDFLRSQQETPGQARLTLIQFDDRYELWAKALPVAEVTPLNRQSYQPRGSTALLDAIGRTIDDTGRRLAEMPEESRPGKVIVAILTDGLENASHRYSARDVAERIAHQREKYSWEFLFLGANQDAIATATSLHIRAVDSATFAITPVGTKASFGAFGRKISAMRMAAARPGPVNPDAVADMTHLLKQEEKKQQGSA